MAGSFNRGRGDSEMGNIIYCIGYSRLANARSFQDVLPLPEFVSFPPALMFWLVVLLFDIKVCNGG